jgi:hypothetical protein
MLCRSMAASNTIRGKLGFLVFLVCVAFSAFGVWYLNGGRWEEEEQDVDNDEEPIDPSADGGGYRRGQKKKKAQPTKAKAGVSRQARSGVARHAEGPAPAPVGPGPTGPSYESAIAGNNLKLAPGAQDVPDLTDAELAGPLRDGSFLDACGVPTTTQVTVKVAIRHGRAVGISVYPVPPSAPIAGCVERHVKSIQWPPNAKMDSFVTTY